MLKLTTDLNIMFSGISTTLNKTDFRPYYETSFISMKITKLLFNFHHFLFFCGANETTPYLAETPIRPKRKHGGRHKYYCCKHQLMWEIE